jgi:hypothetical protein
VQICFKFITPIFDNLWAAVVIYFWAINYQLFFIFIIDLEYFACFFFIKIKFFILQNKKLHFEHFFWEFSCTKTKFMKIVLWKRKTVKTRIFSKLWLSFIFIKHYNERFFFNWHNFIKMKQISSFQLIVSMHF